MTVRRIRIFERKEETGWSATSPDLDGYIAVADGRDELRKLVDEGVSFYLNSKDFVINYQQIEKGKEFLSSSTFPSRLSSSSTLSFSWGSNAAGLHMSSSIGAA